MCPDRIGRSYLHQALLAQSPCLQDKVCQYCQLRDEGVLSDNLSVIQMWFWDRFLYCLSIADQLVSSKQSMLSVSQCNESTLGFNRNSSSGKSSQYTLCLPVLLPGKGVVKVCTPAFCCSDWWNDPNMSCPEMLIAPTLIPWDVGPFRLLSAEPSRPRLDRVFAKEPPARICIRDIRSNLLNIAWQAIDEDNCAVQSNVMTHSRVPAILATWVETMAW